MISVNPELALARQQWEELKKDIDDRIYLPLSVDETEIYQDYLRRIRDLAAEWSL